MHVRSARPYFVEEDIPLILEDVKQALETGALTLGPNGKKLEEEFAAYVGTKGAIAVNSGTSALEIVLKYFGVQGKEVIVPTNSFVASANTVSFAGGRPVICDIKKETLCIDPEDAKKKITDKTAGIMVVHLAGLIPPETTELREFCEEKGLFFMEDAAQAQGASLDGVKAGNLSQAACFSFFPTKVMTTGEGGIITTNDEKLVEFARSMRHHGVMPNREHDKQGYNWRLPELSAILGRYQLKRLDYFVEERNKVARKYDDGLKDVDNLELIKTPANSVNSYYKYSVLFPEGIQCLEFAKQIKEKYDIDTAPLYYPPIHLQPVYKNLFGYKEGMLPVSEHTLKRQLCLPMFVGLKDDEINYVIQSIKEVAEGLK